MRSDDGSISAFAVIVTVAMMLAAGLVLDGARLLSARRLADDIAGNAARAGAQAVDERHLRGGRTVIDPIGGSDAVARYLATGPASGRARIDDDTVTVDVRLPVRMVVLGLAGVRDTAVTASRRARAVRGVTAGEAP